MDETLYNQWYQPSRDIFCHHCSQQLMANVPAEILKMELKIRIGSDKEVTYTCSYIVDIQFLVISISRLKRGLNINCVAASASLNNFPYSITFYFYDPMTLLHKIFLVQFIYQAIISSETWYEWWYHSIVMQENPCVFFTYN